jgi:lysine decarboxylase
VINSIHKTLAGFGQTAVLNVQGKTAFGPCPGGVDLLALEDRLQQVQTSSPSYILLASLDANGEILENNRGELIYEWGQDIRRFYEEAATIPGVRMIPPAPWMDATKINIGISEPALSGAKLAEVLRERYGIQVELHNKDMVMCLTGLGTGWNDLSKLLQALHRIVESHHEEMTAYGAVPLAPVTAGAAAAAAAAGMTPQEKKGRALEIPAAGSEAWLRPHEVTAIPEEKEWIPAAEAAGRVAAAAVTPYPPGVPLICPGERYTAEDVRHIALLEEEGEIVMGLSEGGKVLVGK